MNVSKQVTEIRKWQDQLVGVQNKIRAGVKRLDNAVETYVRERFREAFPKTEFDFLTSFHCGSQTDAWKPQVFLYRVNDLTYSGSFWYKDFAADNRQTPPVPTRKLLAFLKTLTEEIGVKVTLVRKKPLWDAEKEKFWDNYMDRYAEGELQCC